MKLRLVVPKKLRQCIVCGRNIPKKSDRSWPSYNHSVVCGKKCLGIVNRRKIECKCDYCGKIFKRYSYFIKKHQRHFCCNKCRSSGRKKIPDPHKNYYKRKYYKYRRFDKDKKVALPNYSLEEFVERLQHECCYYCSRTVNLGLDRIDNRKGHTKENTLVCCDTCNMTRGNRFTVEQMEKLGKVISEFDPLEVIRVYGGKKSLYGRGGEVVIK